MVQSLHGKHPNAFGINSIVINNKEGFIEAFIILMNSSSKANLFWHILFTYNLFSMCLICSLQDSRLQRSSMLVLLRVLGLENGALLCNTVISVFLSVDSHF